MGGGRSTTQALYGSWRKFEISRKMIERVMRKYGVPVGVRYVKVKVVDEKNWTRSGAAAFYQSSENTLYIRRKYYAGRQTFNVISHELIHGQSGPHRYRGIGASLEEGTVEYITQGSQSLGVRGRSALYSGGYFSYPNEVNVVSKLMQIVGRDRYLKYWKEGFGVRPGSIPSNAGHQKMARDLREKGFSHTAHIIQNRYYGVDQSREQATEQLKQAISKDVQEGNKPLVLGIEPGEKVKDFKTVWKYGEDFNETYS